MKKKKRTALGLCLLLLLVTCSGCSSTETEGEEENETEAATYQVSFDDESLYTSSQDSYEAGETVEVYFEAGDDTSEYSFYVNDELTEAVLQDGSYLITFTMPQEDVLITYQQQSYQQLDLEIDLDIYSLIYHQTTQGEQQEDLTIALEEASEGLVYLVVTQIVSGDELISYYEVDEAIVNEIKLLVTSIGFNSWSKNIDPDYDEDIYIELAYDFGEYVVVTNQLLVDDCDESFQSVYDLLQEYLDNGYLLDV